MRCDPVPCLGCGVTVQSPRKRCVPCAEAAHRAQRAKWQASHRRREGAPKRTCIDCGGVPFGQSQRCVDCREARRLTWETTRKQRRDTRGIEEPGPDDPRCSVCGAHAEWGARWCEEHRPRFDRSVAGSYTTWARQELRRTEEM